MITCKKNIEERAREKGSIERAYFFATKKYIKPVLQPYYHSYFPFHTTIGGIVFFISIGWLAWCLNYLLLFASVHQSSVSDNILTSFGFTELETVFITQPISLLCVILIGYLSKKIKNWLGFKTDIHLQSIYYYSDPYKNKHSTEFSTRFAFEIFVNIPSQVSYSLNNIPNKIKNLGYASVESVVDYIEKKDLHFSNKSHKFNKKELAIKNLYDNMRKQNIDIPKMANVRKIEAAHKIEEAHNLEENEDENKYKIKINTTNKIDKNLYYFKKNLPAWRP
jgi:hypothetical protein